MVDKGKISSLRNNGKIAEVIPSTAEAAVTCQLVVSELIQKHIDVGDEVVYATFEDNTGIVLAKMDGTWSHKVDGKIEITDNVIAKDIQTSAVQSLNGHKHEDTHGGTSSGSDKTSAPIDG